MISDVSSVPVTVKAAMPVANSSEALVDELSSDTFEQTCINFFNHLDKDQFVKIIGLVYGDNLQETREPPYLMVKNHGFQLRFSLQTIQWKESNESLGGLDWWVDLSWSQLISVDLTKMKTTSVSEDRLFEVGWTWRTLGLFGTQMCDLGPCLGVQQHWLPCLALTPMFGWFFGMV